MYPLWRLASWTHTSIKGRDPHSLEGYFKQANHLKTQLNLLVFKIAFAEPKISFNKLTIHLVFVSKFFFVACL